MSKLRIVSVVYAFIALAACISDSPSVARSNDAGGNANDGSVTADADTKDDGGGGSEDAEASAPPAVGTPLGTTIFDVNGSSSAGFGGADGTAMQKDGSLVFVGTHADALVLRAPGAAGTTVLTPKSPRVEGYLVVLRPDGTVKWTAGVADTGPQSPAPTTATFRAVAVDGNGDVFAIADYVSQGSIHGPGRPDYPLTARGSGGEAIVKFDGQTGSVKWALELSSNQSGSGYIGRALSVVGGRILVLTNAFRGVYWNGNVTTQGSFVGLLDDGPQPTPVAYKVLGTQPADRATTAVLAPDKTPILAGEFFSTSLELGGIVLSQPSGTLSDGFIVAMQQDLSSARWAKRLEYSWAGNSNYGDQLHVSASGAEVVLSGLVKGQVICDGTNFLSKNGTMDGFIGTFDPSNGTLRAVPVFGGSGDDWVAAAEPLPNDTRLVAGTYGSPGLGVDTFMLPPPGKSGAFFYKRKGGGVPYAYAVAGVDVEASGTALLEAPSQVAYAIGAFTGTMTSAGKEYKSEAGGSKLSLFVTRIVP